MERELKKLSGLVILITGAAGFIGFHLAKKLLKAGVKIIGLDNFNNYYSVGLKEKRNSILAKHRKYKIYRGDLADLDFVRNIFKENKIDKVVNLAAQTGVRHSLINPYSYFQSNVTGFLNLINEAKEAGVKDFIYASSSSVYGDNKKQPWSIFCDSDHPISPYAATKKIDEVIAYTYHHLYRMNCTGLRFFTVYGPYGRPDMAYFSFTEDIVNGRKIKVFNSGKMKRDFTYVDDVVSGIISSLYHSYPWEVFNLGSGHPVELNVLIEMLGRELGCSVKKKYLPMQKGEVVETFADIDYSRDKLEFNPKTKIDEGVKKFIKWYKAYREENNSERGLGFTKLSEKGRN